jgi:hypothetical protein
MNVADDDTYEQLRALLDKHPCGCPEDFIKLNFS